MSGAEAPKIPNPTPEQPKPTVQKPKTRPTATPQSTDEALEKMAEEAQRAGLEAFKSTTKIFREKPYNIDHLIESKGAENERDANLETVKEIRRAVEKPPTQVPKAKKAEEDSKILEELSGKGNK